MGNMVKTAKYTAWDFIPLNLFKQFHAWTNWYFLAIVIINFIPQINAFANFVSWIPVAAVLLSTAIKDAVEAYQCTKSDSRLNNTPCRVYQNGQYECTTWKKLKPGDIVRLRCNEVVPADCVVLHSSDPQGVCFIETANLDGESNLKQREAIRFLQDMMDFKPEVMISYRLLIEAPNSEVYRINGTLLKETMPDTTNAVSVPQSEYSLDTIEEDSATNVRGGSATHGEQVPINKENMLLRGCKLRNTDYVDCIVAYAGKYLTNVHTYVVYMCCQYMMTAATH
jgi:phospholipid-translocating ATPase